jgi:uncharacterized membrane protein YeaQ/YmgE (transglycosylase-associated protein family)
MHSIAGVSVWIFLGALVGWSAGKWTANDDPHHLMANLGVSITAAVLAGAVVTAVDGAASFGMAIVFAFVAACVAVAAFRGIHPGRSHTLR